MVYNIRLCNRDLGSQEIPGKRSEICHRYFTGVSSSITFLI